MPRILKSRIFRQSLKKSLFFTNHQGMSFISLHSNWRESWFLRDELGELFLNFSPLGDAVRSTSQYNGLLFLFEAKFKDFSVLLFFSILFLLFTLFDELKFFSCEETALQVLMSYRVSVCALLEKSLIPIGIIGYFFAPWHSACLLPGYKPICTGKLKEIYPGNNLIGESFFTFQIPYQDINQL